MPSDGGGQGAAALRQRRSRCAPPTPRRMGVFCGGKLTAVTAARCLYRREEGARHRGGLRGAADQAASLGAPGGPAWLLAAAQTVSGLQPVPPVDLRGGDVPVETWPGRGVAA